jgi:cephalosporin hydroxylase
MVSLDSDHHSAHVQAEIDLLGRQFVTPGCYLVVEDGCFDLFARDGQIDRARVGGSRIPEFGGPLDAIERQLGGDLPNPMTADLFWRDESVEALSPVSHSPCGWWRRHE